MTFAIKKLLVTPSQRLVMEINPAEPEPLEYEIKLTATDPNDVLEETFTGEKYRTRQLFAPHEYALELTAVYDDPGDNQVLTVPKITVSTSLSMAVLLRQTVWDILADAEIMLGSRDLYALHDGYFQPKVLRVAKVASMPLPFFEVGMPILRNTRFESNVRELEEWRIPLRIMDAINKDNPDELGGVWHLAEKVKRALNLTCNLNLGNRGVLPKSWSWRVMEEPDPERERMSGLRLWLTVMVQREIGAIGV